MYLQCLKVVCQDMFFSRTKQSSVAQSVMGSSVNSRQILEQALAPLAKKSDDKVNVVGELVEMKVDQPVANEYSPQVMSGGLLTLYLIKKLPNGIFSFHYNVCKPFSLGGHSKLELRSKKINIVALYLFLYIKL